jgi:hypothetical protein
VNKAASSKKKQREAGPIKNTHKGARVIKKHTRGMQREQTHANCSILQKNRDLKNETRDLTLETE